MATAENVLKVAAGELGYSRWTDPLNGTKYGRWFAGLIGDSQYAQNGVPYCAMFVSWVMDQAKATVIGVPGAYCPYMLGVAREAGLVIQTADAKPGDVVYFDWDGGVADHIGFVEKNCGTYLQCIEGNTNNGQVARRTRAYSSVCGIVRPDYVEGENPVVGALAPSAMRPIYNNADTFYRAYNNSNGDHLIATSYEVDALPLNWTTEGVSFKSDGHGQVAIYRMYDKNSDQHFYTASFDEAVKVNRDGWEWECVPFFGKLIGNPMYRLYNPNTGAHHYTVDAGEATLLIKEGWNDEGIGWYV